MQGVAKSEDSQKGVTHTTCGFQSHTDINSDGLNFLETIAFIMSLKVIKLETHQTIGYCIHYNYKYIGLCKVKADVGILTLLLPKAN